MHTLRGFVSVSNPRHLRYPRKCIRFEIESQHHRIFFETLAERPRDRI
jgi:hypothetical protein